jgi:hypothetical protein
MITLEDGNNLKEIVERLAISSNKQKQEYKSLQRSLQTSTATIGSQTIDLAQLIFFSLLKYQD